jgi:hypothetical protein
MLIANLQWEMEVAAPVWVLLLFILYAVFKKQVTLRFWLLFVLAEALAMAIFKFAVDHSP